ncbi:hypothetical protein ASG01_10700 [Chryseobacterium sp. Leaf180]|uniref:2'-5' RNA ligase family protein n=1 Tax=Chryseobacterium sp. Leaf180 TaxID=1736289 RepID=UPI0006F5214C|nr:2'-5' RNA ligase family protein [Chryseobacterium sp. Leaf180]KQR92390.1 hypothetical protein ASG01_10700 [Chryseobacterium sp. Leaf180]
MKALYSVIFYLDRKTIQLLNAQKINLRQLIGSFASSNSIAHITIAEFSATPEEINYLIQRLNTFVKSQEKLNALFDSLSCSSYSKCAVYLPATDVESKIHDITKAVRKRIKTEKSDICTPHISLGRKLSEQQLKSAADNFSDVTFECEIGQIALRKYDPSIGQFTIEKQFTFGGNRSGGTQLSFWS